MSDHETPPVSPAYRESSLWWKLGSSARRAGEDVVERALRLHYAAQRSDTPAWAKSAIYGAIAYFILPIDAIPDFIPLTGYSDDLTALAAALTTVSFYINDDVKGKASRKMASWLGKQSEQIEDVTKPEEKN